MNEKKEANPAREIKNEGALHSFALKSLVYMMLRSTDWEVLEDIRVLEGLFIWREFI